MQILSRNKRQRFVIMLAATLSLAQPVLASANNSINDLAERESIIAGISSPNLKDDVLYRPRWSLPANGSLQKLPLDDEDSDVDATVKAMPAKKPAVMRLNLGQNAQTKTTSDSDENQTPSPTSVKNKTIPAETEPTNASPQVLTPAKRPAPVATPQAAPAVQTSPQAPAQTPIMSAPIPGAFIINHAPSSQSSL